MTHPCLVTRHSCSLQKGVGLSTSHDDCCHVWLLYRTSVCLSKQNTLPNYTANLYLECSVVAVYSFSFRHFWSQFGAAGNNTVHLILPPNYFLQLFLKTIGSRYIYPLSWAFLIYAVPTGRERKRRVRLNNMVTNCNVPPLCSWSRPGLPARAVNRVIMVTCSLIFPEVSRHTAPLWILSQLSYGLSHLDFLKASPPTLIKSFIPLSKGKVTFPHVHTWS